MLRAPERCSYFEVGSPFHGSGCFQGQALWGLLGWFGGTLGIKPPKCLCHPVKLFAPRVIHGQAVIGVFIYCLRILHIYAAKGMRAYTLAAAERMKLLRRLDAKEHRGKVIQTILSCKQWCLGWAWALHD